MTALLVGTALAVASLCYVLYPLLRATPAPGLGRVAPRPDLTVERQGYAVDALRELEFDRQTGKISDADYGPLKARYTEQAVAVMRGEAPGGKACPNCGPRAESDAEFCSNCGARLGS
ncbi:MAG TPA: hypothetical protein VNO75_12185 [Gemmatimonadaceae bacterium]|nr:hypothetical protein [Gemmatimonadaceae bacterium]